MNGNDESSSFEKNAKTTSGVPSGVPSKKTVEQFLDEMDSWDKIAAELDDDASFDVDAEAEAVSAGWNQRTARDPKLERADESNSTQRSTKSGSYLVQYDDADKIDEDYETRIRRREKSVWNNGDWRRDGLEKKGAAPRRNGNAGPESNDDERGGSVDSFGERRSYYRSPNRPDDRSWRPSQVDGENGRGTRDAEFERPNDQRNGDYRDDYRNGDRRPDERRGSDYYRVDGRRPDDRRDFGRRDAFRPNSYGDRERRPDDGREYRSFNGRQVALGNDRDSNRDSYRRPDAFDRRAPNDGFHENGRRNFRGADRDAAEPNYRSNDKRFGRRSEPTFDARNGYKNVYQEGDRESTDRRRPRFYGERTESLEPTIGARGKRGEPLSLAEEIAARQHKSRRSTQRREIDPTCANDGGEFQATLEANERDENALAATSDAASEIVVENADGFETQSESERQIVAELERMEPRELVAEARRQNLETLEGERFRDLVVRVLRARLLQNGLMYGEGTLEILPDEFGFLRSPDSRYVSCPDDIYISPSQIRRFGLRNGLTIFGQIRPPKERERYFALLRVETINDRDPNALATKPFFDDLVPVHPNEQIVLETPRDPEKAATTEDDGFDARILDLLAPFGFGQRGLLVAPPCAGTTTFIQKTAKSVLANYPDCHVFIVLVDERPEEITEMERKLRGPRCEVVGSTFDEAPTRHIQIAEIALEKAKRMVEYGQNVVLFLDSITRLTRAWNAERAELGQPIPTVLDPAVLQRPKKYFSSARKVDGDGSLTIFATASSGAGVPFDDDAFKEFKSAANLVVRLDRTLAEKRIWPALDVAQSGARREETILDADKYRQIGELRRRLAGKTSEEALKYLRAQLSKTATNADFLASLDEEKNDAQ